MFPKILVVEGNPKANCERAESFGTLSAGDRYCKSLRDICPTIHIEKVYGADIDRTLPVGAEISSFHGVVIGGSALHSYDNDVAVTRQLDLIREVFNAGIPVLGSCWGLQIAVIAAGGGVAKSVYGRELGIARKITLTVAGRAHDLFRGKSTVFDSACIHLDEVVHIPEGAVVLASNHHSNVQAIAFRCKSSDFWGVQYHPEFDLFHLSKLSRMYSDMMLKDGFYHDEEQANSIADELSILSQDTSRSDLAWKLGIDDDILDDNIRTIEIKNWIELKVIPRLKSFQ